MRFKAGDKVVVPSLRLVGVTYAFDEHCGYWQVRGSKARLQGPDDSGSRWAFVREDELMPHSWIRPGIGAVVAMVAAAKVAAAKCGLATMTPLDRVIRLEEAIRAAAKYAGFERSETETVWYCLGWLEQMARKAVCDLGLRGPGGETDDM